MLIGSVDLAGQQSTTLGGLPIHSPRAKIWINFIIVQNFGVLNSCNTLSLIPMGANP